MILINVFAMFLKDSKIRMHLMHIKQELKLVIGARLRKMWKEFMRSADSTKEKRFAINAAETPLG